MSKPLIRIYHHATLKPDSSIELTDKQHNYLINVMRQKIGSEIIIFNNNDGEFKAQIKLIQKKSLTVFIKNITRAPLSSKHLLNLAFAPVKGDLNNVIIQKATELGVNKIIPIITERTIIRDIKYEKLQNVAIEAAEQCNRINVPEIANLTNLPQLCELKFDHAVFCYEQENIKNVMELIPIIQNAQNILIIVGPEGGFTEKEYHLIKNQLKHTSVVSLNHNVLRAETAAIAAIAIISAMLYNQH